MFAVTDQDVPSSDEDVDDGDEVGEGDYEYNVVSLPFGTADVR
jgi:hypothetical protein